MLYISNNLIAKWDEIDKLKDLTKINKVLFKGNPIYNEQKGKEMDTPLLEILKRVPAIQEIDGTYVTEKHRN